jgi:hypothetical protein
MMHNQKKKVIMFTGYMLSVGMFVNLFHTFLIAYLSPNKRVMVTIDTMGEAHVEWFMLCLVFDVILVGLYFCFKQLGIKKRSVKT